MMVKELIESLYEMVERNSVSDTAEVKVRDSEDSLYDIEISTDLYRGYDELILEII